MIYLTCTPLNIKTSSCMHIILGKEEKSPHVTMAINHVKSVSSSIVKLGEHILTPRRFASYETVIVHNVSDINFMDALSRIQKFDYPERLKQVALDPHRQLVVYGNSIKFLGEHITRIPNKAIFNDTYKSPSIDTSTAGIKLFPKIRLDVDVITKMESTHYRNLVTTLSRTETFYGLDATVVYMLQPPEKPTVKYGKLYKAVGDKFIELKDTPSFATEEEVNDKQLRDPEEMTPSEVEVSEAPPAKSDTE